MLVVGWGKVSQTTGQGSSIFLFRSIDLIKNKFIYVVTIYLNGLVLILKLKLRLTEVNNHYVTKHYIWLG
ncbi:MAG TPA: hypothetical protein DCE56_33315 [Cyanobacteria bacterium UBA8553]|nr:hypothetical protein [Cyanobacteria bacterium UBA8553]